VPEINQLAKEKGIYGVIVPVHGTAFRTSTRQHIMTEMHGGTKPVPS
jgi:hypothetical protein